ncbi:GFA family protein [Pseudomonas taetrolens]|uniref:GFA family protein n=1 Tax=Pseudomonas taetrolens TaxID=47884 RepID=UPI003F950BCB
MNGSCLCGTIEFELTHKPAVFYRCHCSLCRKQSGVGYNLATLVKDSEFRWIKGENCIASWSKPTGYRTDFCNVCGSTVPNSLRDVPYGVPGVQGGHGCLKGSVWISKIIVR